MALLLIRLQMLLAMCGLSRSTIYTRIKNGLWPKPIKLGERAIAWPADDVHQVLDAYVSGKLEEEIKEIVRQIHANRRSGV